MKTVPTLADLLTGCLHPIINIYSSHEETKHKGAGVEAQAKTLIMCLPGGLAQIQVHLAVTVEVPFPRDPYISNGVGILGPHVCFEAGRVGIEAQFFSYIGLAFRGLCFLALGNSEPLNISSIVLFIEWA